MFFEPNRKQGSFIMLSQSGLIRLRLVPQKTSLRSHSSTVSKCQLTPNNKTKTSKNNMSYPEVFFIYGGVTFQSFQPNPNITAAKLQGRCQTLVEMHEARVVAQLRGELPSDVALPKAHRSRTLHIEGRLENGRRRMSGGFPNVHVSLHQLRGRKPWVRDMAT